MALPTAQLGQLGTMSMPYSMPTYEKGPSIWEKALASFLVNAAGGVATGATQNVMQKDYAPEFGKEKAGLWDKLVGGAAVTKDDAKQMRQNTFIADQNQAEIDARAGQSDADAANALLRLDQQGRQGQELETVRSMNDLLRTDRDIAAQDKRQGSHEKFLADEGRLDRAARSALQQEEYAAKRSMPDQQLNQTIVDRMRGTGLVAGTPSQRPNGVSSAAADYIKGAGQPVQAAVSQGYGMPAEPQFVSNGDDVAKLLAAGKTPEEILTIVGRQRAVDAAARARPLPDLNAAPAQQPGLVDLLRKLGIDNSPLTTSPRGRDY